jgi:hypothetical protein
MNPNNNSILEKIRALFRLADTTRGASRAEAELAMQRAQEIMAKYGISKIDVADASEEARAARKFNIHQREYRTGRPKYPSDLYIAHILHACFNVRVIWSTEFEKIRTKPRKAGGIERERWIKRHIYIFVGEPEDTELAEMATQELHKMMRGLFDQYMRQHYGKGFWGSKDSNLPNTDLADEVESGETSVGDLRHSFLRGMERGFIDAAKKGQAKAFENEAASRVSAYAIVLVDKSKAIVNWIEQNITTSKSKGGARSSSWHGHAYGEGYKRGGEIKVGQRKIGEKTSRHLT